MSNEVPYERLERHFHEPVRLAILSQLVNSPEPLPFTELKDSLELTFGNLDRHLKVLTDAGIIEVAKESGKGRPRTLISISQRGREDFVSYLESLEQILKTAAKGLQQQSKSVGDGPGSVFVRKAPV